MTFHVRLKQIESGFLVDVSEEETKIKTAFAVKSREELGERLLAVLKAFEQCYEREEAERFSVYRTVAHP